MFTHGLNPRCPPVWSAHAYELSGALVARTSCGKAGAQSGPWNAGVEGERSEAGQQPEVAGTQAPISDQERAVIAKSSTLIG